MKTPRRAAVSAALFPVVIALFPSWAGAQTIDWAPAGTVGNWVDGANWLGGAAPLLAEDARLGDGGSATIGAGESAEFRALFLGDPLNGPNAPLAGSTGDPNGTLTMDGGTLTGENLRIGTDNTTTGTGGTGLFTFNDGTINLNETGSNVQALEIGRANGSTGTFLMGDGDTTSPMLNYTGGRFEVGQNGTSTSRFELRSGTVTGTGQNFIIGQSNGVGTATVIVGGFDVPATFTTSNELNMNNQDASLTIEENGSVSVRDLQFANNAARTTTVTINTGGTFTNNRDMNDRGGVSNLNINGGTLVFANTSPPGTAGREREVENLAIAGGALEFRVGAGQDDSILPLSVDGDDPLSASITGDVSINMVAGNANNTATLDTWIAGSATWDTANPDGAQWDLGVAPDRLLAGTSIRVVQTDVAAGTTPITTDASTNVTSASPDWAVFEVLDGGSNLVGYRMQALSDIQVAPATAVIDDVLADVVIGANPGDSLTVAQDLGANAGQLLIEGANSVDFIADLNIGGTTTGTVTVGSLGGAQDIAVSVGDDIVFGDGGPQGGFLRIYEGSVTVAGDIVEGTDDPNVIDGAGVNNAQVQINTGTVEANALRVAGTSTSQRFAVGEDNGSVAGLTISATSGLASVVTTGTVSIGAGTNASKDGDPGVVSGASGRVVVGPGGSLAPNNMRVAENGDSVGSLTIDGGDVAVTASTYVGGGETNANDSETVGMMTLNSGTFTAGGNTEIGRDGTGFLTINGGTFTQSDANLVLGQSGNNDDNNTARGTVVISDGTVVVGVAGGATNPSDLNINESGGSVEQNGGTVAIERNLNLGSNLEPSSYTLNAGSLTIGQDINYRAGDGADTMTVAGGSLEVGRNVNLNAGTSNKFAIDGSGGTVEVTGNFTANGTAVLSFTTDATSVSQVEVLGTLNLNGATLEVDVSALGNGSAFDLTPVTLFTAPTVLNAFGNVAFDDPVPGAVFPDNSGYILRSTGGAVFLEAALNVRNPLDDDDGDTIINLLEDAFGSDLDDPNDGFGALPTVTTDGANVTLVFQRIIDEERFVYEVEQSTDGTNWTVLFTAPVVSGDQGGVPAGYQRQEVSVPVDPGTPVLLLRMNIIID